MIATLAGENSFGLSSALRELIRQFVERHGDMALEQLDGETADFARMQEALTSAPFLADKKLVVLRTPGANKQFTEHVENLLNDVPESTDVVIVEPKLDKRLAYYKFLKKQTAFREFPDLDERSLAAWLVDTAKAGNATLSTGDANYLVERVGANQQLLASELEKLMLYNPAITRETIDAMTERSPQSSIFELLEAAFGGRKARVAELYEEQRQQKVDPLQIIAMLSWQLHILTVIANAGGRSADDVAREAKLNPFVVRKSQGTACRLGAARLKAMISDLLEIDTKARRTRLDLDEALLFYLLTLSE